MIQAFVVITSSIPYIDYKCSSVVLFDPSLLISNSVNNIIILIFTVFMTDEKTVA